MRSLVSLLVLSGFLAVAVPVQAKPDGAGPRLSLAECVERALAQSPNLRAAAADVGVARARLDRARAGRFGTAEYTQILGVVNEARGNPVFSPDDKNDVFDGLGPFTRLDLAINIPLWTFGKLSAALEAAELGLASAAAAREVKRAEVVLATKKLYYGLLLARQLTFVLEDMLESMEEAIEKTKKKLDDPESEVTDIDVLQLEVGRSRFARGALEVKTSAELARKALARAVGRDPAAPFDIAAGRLRPVEAEVAPVEDYVARGLATRPEWQRLEKGLAAREARVALEEADYYPTFFLATGIQFAWAENRDEQDNPFAYDEFNFIRPVGVLGVRWDLGFLASQAEVAEARAELAHIEASRAEARSGLVLQIHRAHAAFERARKAMQAAERGRRAGRGMLILSVSNFDLGIGSAEELFEGLGAYTETSSDYFRAVHDYNVAVAELSRVVGEELADLEG